MRVACESSKPLRPEVKPGRSLRKDEKEQEHIQANEANYHHFDFSISPASISLLKRHYRITVAE
jgi:hypothetical protein